MVCIKGKWYKPASGVLILLYARINAVKIEEVKIKNKSFLDKKSFLIIKKKGVTKKMCKQIYLMGGQS